MLDLIRETYRGTLIVAGGFDQNIAEKWLKQGRTDYWTVGAQTSSDRLRKERAKVLFVFTVSLIPEICGGIEIPISPYDAATVDAATVLHSQKNKPAEPP